MVLRQNKRDFIFFEQCRHIQSAPMGEPQAPCCASAWGLRQSSGLGAWWLSLAGADP